MVEVNTPAFEERSNLREIARLVIDSVLAGVIPVRRSRDNQSGVGHHLKSVRAGLE